MTRYCSAILALPFMLATVAHAQEARSPEEKPHIRETDLCRAVAQHLWSQVAPVSLSEQTPLAELTAAVPAAFQVGRQSPTTSDQPVADALLQGHAAEPDLAAKLHDVPPTQSVRFSDSNVWLLDRVDGTLGCHTAMTIIVPAEGPAHEIGLPGNPDPTALCALSALTAVAIDGIPALWIEQSGAFSNSLAQSTISITGLHNEAFASPCTMVVDYVVTDRVTHAFCDRVDCVPLIRTAEILATRLRQEETAESLGAGAIQNKEEDANYRRMVEILSAEKQPADLPMFGVPLDTPYTVFADQVTFPVRLDDRHIYLARLGHGGFGWRQTADTLLALFRLRDDRLVPAASAYVSARRTGIMGITIQQ